MYKRARLTGKGHHRTSKKYTKLAELLYITHLLAHGHFRNSTKCTGDRGGTVVNVLCYKSEGRWFDPSWCHWIFH